MYLYHASFDLNEKEKLFIPRIPKSKAKNENDSIKRICFSESIEGCLTAIGNLADQLETTNWNILIFKVDTNELDKEYLRDPQFIYNALVEDALITREWWYLNPINLIGEQYKILDMESDAYFIVHEYQRDQIMNWLLNRGYDFRYVQDLEYLVNTLLYEICETDETGSYIDLSATLADELFNSNHVKKRSNIKLEKV